MFLGLVMVACEDATIDYSSDILGIYIVENTTVDGIYTDYSTLPIEEAWIIDITADNLLSYVNDANLCDSTFSLDARVIDMVTDTSIVFTDNTYLDYSNNNEQLTLYNDDDVMVLAGFEYDFPPPAWTDPLFLTNDEYEPDSSLSLASRISAAGAFQTHYSAVCDDDDFFIFDALGGTVYIIEAEAAIGTDIDLTLSLYSTDSLIAYNDDQASTNVDPKLVWTCLDSGDYYFIVKKYWDYLDPGNSLDDEKGAYTISVDVTKGLLQASPEIIKLHRPVKASRLFHKFFD
ncbi:MAG: hypothetical protein HOB84_14325 [Candidatus Marinimicrobia bacterium]|nr:hypothetical protein [Candidatus Neomarinimicrobiota bacterium]MBT4360641.1 hypothetical protein [Candidatus Neomarinimicrobiota bacterium]MBT4715941.1 hypothetical protein [Candidatus Neomarinimicrobiota bacterium]MBT4948126.1 hypothetical protein [Candidatus Neomarinimicrobiota bacterium]MBT5271008.1 hypothetical protein [Candidatus Neomarinimicrobiota bacterium]